MSEWTEFLILFEESRCGMYSIEWQKWGLPHTDTLIRLVENISEEEIDDMMLTSQSGAGTT